MDQEVNSKTTIAPVMAMVCGLFTAFGCGILMSEPAGSFDVHAEVPIAETEVIPTAYQQVQTGQVHTAQMAMAKRPPRMGPPPEIVVKLKAKDEAKRVCDMFWKDNEAGRAEFQKMIKGKPELKGLRLKRVTYSNEFVLDFGPTEEKITPALKSRYRNAVKYLGALPNIAYAEPNVTAQPGRH